MKNISISDENEGIYLFSGMTLAESDIDPLERIFCRLLDKIAKFERSASTPEGARLNILEHSHDTLWKAHVEAKKILDEITPKVSSMSGRESINKIIHAKIYKQTDKQEDRIELLEEEYCQERREGRKRDERLSEIEEFLGDL